MLKSISLNRFGTLVQTSSNEKLISFCDKLKNHDYRRIAVLLGGSASTSAGVWHPKSLKLKEEAEKLDLPFPEVLFDINYFKFDPYPFYKVFAKMVPIDAKPTANHYFVKLLEEKSMLLIGFTKNFDGLERKAGISENKMIYAHGNSDTFYCVVCNKKHSGEECNKYVLQESPPFCSCGGPVKPNILFVGEKLNNQFYHGSEMLAYADLMIIIGCSLSVFPFSSLPALVGKKVPRVVIAESEEVYLQSGFDFEHRDMFLHGHPDEVTMKIVENAGWMSFFNKNYMGNAKS